MEERLRPHLDKTPPPLWSKSGSRVMRAATPPSSSICIGCCAHIRILAQDETFDVTRMAHHLHVPAQVVRAAQWRIHTLVLIRRPRDAVLSLVIRDPISVDQALKYYTSFYETSEKYRDAFVLGRFEEVTEDFGQVMKRLNDKFGTTFSVFRHDEENVSKLFAGMEAHARKKYGETLWERKVQRPAAVRERIKDEIQYDLENPKRKKLIARADAVYDRLTNPMRERE